MMNQVSKIEDSPLAPKTGAMASGGAIRAIVPQTLDDTFRLANMIVKAKMAPASFDTAEAVAVALLHGLEVGLPPMMALQSIAVINGRPTLWGDGAMALVRATGLLEEFEEWIDGAGQNMIAYCKIKRRGEKAVTHSFSVDDAMKAKLWGKAGPWTTYPRRMIAMRPRSWCLRDVFADALKGLRIAEEVLDTDMKDITPISVPSAPTPPSAPIETPKAQELPPIVDHVTEELPPIVDVDKIADWRQRLEVEPRNIQDEIFEAEIDPYRETGAMKASDYNSLLELVKEP
jgi:hypothetical protein